MKSYRYVGPEAIRDAVREDAPRLAVHDVDALRCWIRTEGVTERTATFIVDTAGTLWVADRRSEHVACAQGEPVLTAGEITFALIGSGVEVVSSSNQSTGYCPELCSWHALATALDVLGLEHDDRFDLECEFRRCECGQTNLVKHGIYECAVCGRALPAEWNFG